MTQRLTPMAQAAVEYARWGWFALPLHGITDTRSCTCPKGHLCRHAGKHPYGRLAPKGTKDASRRPDVVAKWFSIFTWLNVGIVAGPSRLVFLDVDPRNGGVESLLRLVADFGDLPETLAVATGGSGWHYYFASPEQWGRSHLLAPGVEVKAGRSLLVAPPSHHKSGLTYRWIDATVPVAPAPGWLLTGARS